MMKGRLARLGSLIALCVIAILAVAVSAANATVQTVKCTKIHGSGSSLQKVGQEAWIEGFAKLTVKEKGTSKGELELENECGTFETNTYSSTSSGEGLEQFGANEGKLGGAKGPESEFPAFIGSDVGGEATQLKEMEKAGSSKVMSVPVAQSAITVDVSLPEGCSIKPVSGTAAWILADSLVDVYSLALSPNWLNIIQNATWLGKNCDAEPRRLARATASGTTCGFKRFFADLTSKAVDNTEWNNVTNTAENCLSSAKWLTGATPEETGLIEGTIKELKKGSNLVEATYENPNMISYADLADAIATGKFAIEGRPVEHSNKQGLVIQSFWAEIGNGAYASSKSVASPEGLEGESNCSEATYPTAPNVEPGAAWFTVRPTNIEKGGSSNYPICTLTYDFVWQNYSAPQISGKAAYAPSLALTTLAYMHYILLKGQGLLTVKHYLGLPSAVEKAALEGVTKNWHILF